MEQCQYCMWMSPILLDGSIIFSFVINWKFRKLASCLSKDASFIVIQIYTLFAFHVLLSLEHFFGQKKHNLNFITFFLEFFSLILLLELIFKSTHLCMLIIQHLIHVLLLWPGTFKYTFWLNNVWHWVFQ